MPTEQGESFTDDPNDPPTPTASHFPQPLEEVMSTQTKPDEDALACAPEPDQLVAMQLEEEEEETGQLQVGNQSHVIKNVDEIFHTIEGLMSKLRKLKVSLCSGSVGISFLDLLHSSLFFLSMYIFKKNNEKDFVNVVGTQNGCNPSYSTA